MANERYFKGMLKDITRILTEQYRHIQGILMLHETVY